ncbi:hypothetical protein CLAIMM_10461 [Cladophialophora immunda]|nr:hypothetical protein CLAIMM_10461 [Cladophialophora immunda]
MSAPRQSSPLSAGLEASCPILQSLRDTSDIKTQGAASDRVSRMDTIQEEESTEPEDDFCLPCLHAPLAAVEATSEDSTGRIDQVEAIPEYVLKIREAIRLQGQRLQETQLESEQPERRESENEKLDFHIKVGGNRRRTSLLSGARERGRNVVSDIKSRTRRLSTVLPGGTKRDAPVVEVASEEQKRRSSLPGVERTERVSALTSQRRRISAIFSPMLTKLPEQVREKPKIKSKNGTPKYSSVGGECTRTKHATMVEEVHAGDGDGDDTDDGSDNDSEVVGLLSLKPSVSSRPESFDASHFYTPMVPSGSGGDYEYRLHRSRFKHTFDFSKKLASKSVREVRYNVGNVLNARRRGGGWSKLKN